ncbi:MAG: penicillin acylase family protein, partial [bacterium]
DQLQSAFRSLEMIPQHIFAFDLAGDITHLQPGRFPIRKGFNGDIPLEGGDKKYKWSGYIPSEKMPYSKNPEAGFANNSNNFPPIDTGIDLGTTFPRAARFERVREILSSRDDFTIDDMKKMQTDTLNPVARETLPLLLDRIKNLDTDAIKNEIKLLKTWDFNESPDSIAATIYNQWWIELPSHLFNKKMGLFVLSYRDYMDQYSIVLMNLLKNTESAKLWDWLEFENIEQFDRLLLTALEIALDDLKEKYGDNRDDWAWGKVHLTHFAHPSGVEFLVDGGSYGVGGSHYTLNVTHYFPSQGYEATFGASYRFIATIDENNRIIAKSVLPPGNWSAPLSPHFKDQINMWARGELKNLIVYSYKMSQLPVVAILEHKE